jgi:hypothetical protein
MVTLEQRRTWGRRRARVARAVCSALGSYERLAMSDPFGAIRRPTQSDGRRLDVRAGL